MTLIPTFFNTNWYILHKPSQLIKRPSINHVTNFSESLNLFLTLVIFTINKNILYIPPIFTINPLPHPTSINNGIKFSKTFDPSLLLVVFTINPLRYPRSINHVMKIFRIFGPLPALDDIYNQSTPLPNIY